MIWKKKVNVVYLHDASHFEFPYSLDTLNLVATFKGLRKKPQIPIYEFVWDLEILVVNLKMLNFWLMNKDALAFGNKPVWS